MIEQYQHRKYGQPKYTGPHEIDRVNDNGTVRLRQSTANGGAVYCTWNKEHLPLQGLIPLVTRITEQMRAPQSTSKLSSGNIQSIRKQQHICQLVLLGSTRRSSRLPQRSKRSLLSVPLSGGQHAIHRFTTWKPYVYKQYCRPTGPA
jgi:hypothetical protein